MSYSVTTITELVEKLQSEDFQQNGGEIIVNPKKNNTLDFNDEEYYYRRSSFLTIFINNNDKIGYSRNITIDFNNANLTNIFLYPDVPFLYLYDYYNNNNNPRNNTSVYTFKNGNFEVVSNDGYFIHFDSHYTTASGSTNNYDGKVQFINCVFNIKVTNSNHDVLTLSVGQVDFINCVFNIEYVNINKTGINFLHIIANTTNILSSEFRFRFRKINNTTESNSNSFTIIYSDALPNRVVYVFDNVFFLNRLFNSNANSYYNLFKTTGSNIPKLTNYSNNFVGSFDKDNFGGDGKIVISDSITSNNKTCVLFYDSDKIETKNFSNSSNKIGLPTADCKNVEKLTEAGYVFASES